MTTKKSSSPVRDLICACCGGQARGRQWWNQDRGFGLCLRCADWIVGRKTYSPEEFEQTYGRRGEHYGC